MQIDLCKNTSRSRKPLGKTDDFSKCCADERENWKRKTVGKRSLIFDVSLIFLSQSDLKNAFMSFDTF